MRVLRALSLVALCVWPALSVDRIPLDEYRQRRAQIRKDMGDSVVILFGHSEQENGGDLRTGFFQEANFYYLTGWKETGAILVLTPSSEILLILAAIANRRNGRAPNLRPKIPARGR